MYLALCAEGPLGLFPPLGSIADHKHTGTRAPKHVVEFDHHQLYARVQHWPAALKGICMHMTRGDLNHHLTADISLVESVYLI